MIFLRNFLKKFMIIYLSSNYIGKSITFPFPVNVNFSWKPSDRDTRFSVKLETYSEICMERTSRVFEQNGFICSSVFNIKTANCCLYIKIYTSPINSDHEIDLLKNRLACLEV